MFEVGNYVQRHKLTMRKFSKCIGDDAFDNSQHANFFAQILIQTEREINDLY